MPSQIQFHYQFSGNKNKPTILFLHGFMGSGDDWHEVIEYLSSHYRCLTVDLPGHGKTGFERGISFEETGHAVTKFLDDQKIHQCFLTGYSMGGRLALFVTLRYPQYFQRVVLESASPGLRTGKEREERIFQDEKITKELTSGNFSVFLKKWYNQPLFKGLKNHEKFDRLLTGRLKNDPKRLAEALRALGTGKQPSLWREVSQNKVPILLLVGGHDTKFQSIARQMQELNKLIRVEVIDGCSHNIRFQQPEIFSYHLHRFFQRKT